MKEGALVVVGSICEKLMKIPEYANQLETMLMLHVIPEFQNPHGFLRARVNTNILFQFTLKKHFQKLGLLGFHSILGY